MQQLKQVGVAVLCMAGIGMAYLGNLFLGRFLGRQRKLKEEEEKAEKALRQQSDDAVRAALSPPAKQNKAVREMSAEEWALVHGTFTDAVRSLAKMNPDTVTLAFKRDLAFRWWAERWVLQAELMRRNCHEDVDELLSFSLLDDSQGWEHMLNHALENSGMTGVGKLITTRSPNPEYVKIWVARHTRFWPSAQKTAFMEQCRSAFPEPLFSAVFALETQEN